jgi:hypothetical protein
VVPAAVVLAGGADSPEQRFTAGIPGHKVTMTEAEADQRAKELNLQLGAGHDGAAFYVAVQVPDGSWDVERRESKPGLLSSIIDAWSR